MWNVISPQKQLHDMVAYDISGLDLMSQDVPSSSLFLNHLSKLFSPSNTSMLYGRIEIKVRYGELNYYA